MNKTDTDTEVRNAVTSGSVIFSEQCHKQLKNLSAIHDKDSQFIDTEQVTKFRLQDTNKRKRAAVENHNMTSKQSMNGGNKCFAKSKEKRRIKKYCQVTLQNVLKDKSLCDRYNMSNDPSNTTSSSNDTSGSSLENVKSVIEHCTNRTNFRITIPYVIVKDKVKPKWTLNENIVNAYNPDDALTTNNKLFEGCTIVVADDAISVLNGSNSPSITSADLDSTSPLQQPQQQMLDCSDHEIKSDASEIDARKSSSPRISMDYINPSVPPSDSYVISPLMSINVPVPTITITTQNSTKSAKNVIKWTPAKRPPTRPLTSTSPFKFIVPMSTSKRTVKKPFKRINTLPKINPTNDNNISSTTCDDDSLSLFAESIRSEVDYKEPVKKNYDSSLILNNEISRTVLAAECIEQANQNVKPKERIQLMNRINLAEEWLKKQNNLHLNAVQECNQIDRENLAAEWVEKQNSLHLNAAEECNQIDRENLAAEWVQKQRSLHFNAVEECPRIARESLAAEWVEKQSNLHLNAVEECNQIDRENLAAEWVQKQNSLHFNAAEECSRIDEENLAAEWVEKQSNLHLNVVEECNQIGGENLAAEWVQKETRVEDGVPQFEPIEPRVAPRVAPELFSSFCKGLLYDGLCEDMLCKSAHTITENMQNVLSNMSLDALREIYLFVKRNETIFSISFKHIIRCRVKLEHETDIINLLDDITCMPDLDKTPCIVTLIEALESKSRTFEEIIHDILCVHGNKKACLSDILLSLVLEKQNFARYWGLIKTLTRLRVDKIDRGVVEDMISQCTAVSSTKPNLVVDLYNNIIKYLPEASVMFLNERCVHAYVTLLYQLNKSQEANDFYLRRFPNLIANTSSAPMPVHANIQNRYSPNYINSLPNMYTNVLNNSTRPACPPELNNIEQAGNRNESPQPRPLQFYGNFDLLRSYIQSARILETGLFLINVYENIVLRRKFVTTFLSHMKCIAIDIGTFVVNVFNISEQIKSCIKNNKDWISTKHLVGINVINCLSYSGAWESAYDILNALPEAPKCVFEELLQGNGSNVKKFLLCILVLTNTKHFLDAFKWWTNQFIKILHKEIILTPIDKDFRRFVLDSFMTAVLSHNVDIAVNMVKYFIKHDDTIGIEYATYFNTLFFVLLEHLSVEHRNYLISFSSIILSKAFQLLEEPIFRGYLITMLQYIKDKDSLALYKKGCDLKYYTILPILENPNVVPLKTHLSSEEMYLIIHYLFSNIVYHKFRSQQIFLQLIEDKTHQMPAKNIPRCMQSIDKSYNEVTRRIREALRSLSPPLTAYKLNDDNNCFVLYESNVRAHLRVKFSQKYPNEPNPYGM